MFEWLSNLWNTVIPVTLTSNQRIKWYANGCWKLCGVFLKVYIVSTQLVQVADRVKSLRGYWYCVINPSTSNLLLRSFVVPFDLKLGMWNLTKRVSVPREFALEMVSRKICFFHKQRLMEQGEICKDISFPLESVGLWSLTSCWLIKVGNCWQEPVPTQWEVLHWLPTRLGTNERTVCE